MANKKVIVKSGVPWLLLSWVAMIVANAVGWIHVSWFWLITSIIWGPFLIFISVFLILFITVIIAAS